MDANHNDDEGQMAPLLSPTTVNLVPSDCSNNQRAWRLDAHPFWLIPVVIIVSMCRGMTLAPRIQVYNDIACRALAEESSHRTTIDSLGYMLNLAAPSTCSSPAVQARAAQIQASVTTAMSILSAITTGLWSRFGDIHGRKPILCLTIFGALTMEVVFILVTTTKLFGAYAEQFIVLAPFLEGMTGGHSTFNGHVYAYTSDCTPHGSRSKIFSTLQGLVFIGLALGPWIGSFLSSLLVPQEHSGKPMFFISATLLILLLTFVSIILPESLRHQVAPEGTESTPSLESDPKKPILRRIYSRMERFGILMMSPITLFAPRPSPGGSSKKNYNLTFLGVGLFTYLISIGVYQIKYLYAKHIYSWTAVELGYYMSLLWTSRAINLLLIMPIIVSYTKPSFSPGVVASDNIFSEMRFDKRLAQYSLSVDGLADALVVLAPVSSQLSFVAFSCLSSFTSGANPAMHSLGAVCLHAMGRGSEVGSLYGAMAVLSAVAHTISPTLYAILYGSTVATFPKAIFCLAACFLVLVVLSLNGIRTDPERQYFPVDDTEAYVEQAEDPEEEII